MAETLFISDLHLDGERPRILDILLRLLATDAARADALYVLGDLFEYWIGDDDPVPELRPAVQAIRRLADSGVPVYFAHGNRDFLIGERFATESGCRLLPEETIIDLYGTATLLLHGDSLCSDDVDYMKFRTQVRDPRWQATFLALPLEERRKQATMARQVSRESTRNKRPEITDVNADAVNDALRRHGLHQMIHGHTHRPAFHDLDLDGRPARRIVLGDWYERGSVLRCSDDGRMQLCQLD